jgi:protein ERP2
MSWLYVVLELVLLFASLGWCVEFTFVVPDNAKQCFHEDIDKGVKTTIEFQVVTGGQYDIDMKLESHTGQILYNVVKKQYDSFTWTTEQAGTYTVCFSNEFSTFSHKLVYMDFQVGDEKPLPGMGEHATAMTQMESSSQAIHEGLNTVLDYQTHHRLREAQGRKRAEDLNERVLWWSVGETIAVIIIGVGQVLILRNFFAEKKPSQLYVRT